MHPLGVLKMNHYSKHIEHLFTFQLRQLCVFDEFMLLIGADELKVKIIENMVAAEILRYPERGQEEKKAVFDSALIILPSPSIHPPPLLSHLIWNECSYFRYKKFKKLTDKHMFSMFRGAHL